MSTRHAPDALTAQYESFIYPQPIPDLAAYAAAGGHDYSDPSRIRCKLWPVDIAPAQLRILVAGCGANQAAILARANPDCSVVGIDLSTKALENQNRLKQLHALLNLEVRELALEDAGQLVGQFDLIVSTGVLHHLESPERGIEALRGVLAPHGVMSLMVYGLHRRQGLYLVQEALRTLGVGPDTASLHTARRIVDDLPEWHDAQRYIRAAPDLGYDGGFVDTFLNVRDRAYSVPGVMSLIKGAGLQFQAWLDGLYYSPSAAFPPDSPIHEQIEHLPLEQQWHVVDLLTQTVATHRFLVCHSDRPRSDFDLDFTGETDAAAWLDYRPSLHPQLKVTTVGHDCVRYQRDNHSLELAGEVTKALSMVDGTRTFKSIVSGLSAEGRTMTRDVASLFSEWDHMRCAVG